MNGAVNKSINKTTWSLMWLGLFFSKLFISYF
nr:MAG TPA: hypothetical protein [Caudoviricetes sp.]